MTMLKRWLPAILVCLLIFVLSSLPGATVSSNGDVDYTAHKAAHVVIYSVLCLTFYRATKSVPLAVLLTILYGFSDELHQSYVISRSGNVQDVFVDSSAALVTGFVLWKYYQFLPKPLQNWLRE